VVVRFEEDRVDWRRREGLDEYGISEDRVMIGGMGCMSKVGIRLGVVSGI
jgi:hypothetical protein